MSWPPGRADPARGGRRGRYEKVAAPKKGRSRERPGQARTLPGPDPDRHRGAHRRHVPLRSHDAASRHRPGRRYEHHARGEERAGQAERDQQDQHEHRGRHHRTAVSTVWASPRPRCRPRAIATSSSTSPRARTPKQAREQVGTTAKLYFRPVLALEVQGGAATASPTPSASTSGSPSPSASARRATRRPRRRRLAQPVGQRHLAGPCRHRRPEGRRDPDAERARRPRPPARRRRRPPPPDAGDRGAPGEVHGARLHQEGRPRRQPVTASSPASPTVACGQDSQGQWQKYILGPAEVAGTDVDEGQGRRSTPQGAAGWQVTMDFTSKGSQEVRDDHRQASRRTRPRRTSSRIVLDGEVVSAPYVSTALTGGTARDLRQLHPAVAPRTWPTCCRTARCRSPSRRRASPR